ncbi:fructokinase [Leptolinea sp. HRD-7]|nr:fructokinase [Leptolinea sp. HRD-7]
MDTFFGGIEAGGTKFVCVVASGPDKVLAQERFATTSPDETIGRTINFFTPFVESKQVRSLGIAAFGPVDLDKNSSTYGYITSTPKPGWAQTNLLGAIRDALKIPCGFDTDVNAAAFGEYYWVSENRELDPLLYITVGTGIGVGGIVNGKTLHGLIHPEAGHMFIPHDRKVDPFPGVCPFHEDCLEGLASGPSMAKRWGQPAETLPDDHPGWDLEAKYIGFLISNLLLNFSPKRIVLGGGVPQHTGFIPKVRKLVQQQLNGYIQSTRVTETIEDLIVSPTLGSQAGVMGAIALAKTAIE